MFHFWLKKPSRIVVIKAINGVIPRKQTIMERRSKRESDAVQTQPNTITKQNTLCT